MRDKLAIIVYPTRGISFEICFIPWNESFNRHSRTHKRFDTELKPLNERSSRLNVNYASLHHLIKKDLIFRYIYSQ